MHFSSIVRFLWFYRLVDPPHKKINKTIHTDFRNRSQLITPNIKNALFFYCQFFLIIV